MKTPWGSWEVLDEGADYKIKKLIVQPGEMTSLQSHKNRREEWFIVEGQAEIYWDERVIKTPNMRSSIFIGKGVRHRITNNGDVPVVVIELQFGICTEEDINRFEDKYGRD